MHWIDRIRAWLSTPRSIEGRLEAIQTALGRIELRQTATIRTGLEESEFQVFSQWGEDGIIQYLLRHVPIERRIFVEFGVEDYTQANTRFLLAHDNWSGLVMDASAANCHRIQRDRIYWTHNLKVGQAFVDAANVNQLIAGHGIEGDIGLLSIDIDGNDYWVWKAIDVIQPRIVICEYNSRFGPKLRLTIPYDPKFHRSRAHHNNLYFGASIAALASLGESKGYGLVGSNCAGNNLFFVRRDLLGDLPVQPATTAFRRSQFRESRGPGGELTFLGWEAGFGDAAGLPVLDLDRQEHVPIASLVLE